MKSTIPLTSKVYEDVMGGDKQFATSKKTSDFRCPKCETKEAFFYQLQIRSADEPMTTFLRCKNCAHQWNDNN